MCFEDSPSTTMFNGAVDLIHLRFNLIEKNWDGVEEERANIMKRSIDDATWEDEFILRNLFPVFLPGGQGSSREGSDKAHESEGELLDHNDRRSKVWRVYQRRKKGHQGDNQETLGWAELSWQGFTQFVMLKLRGIVRWVLGWEAHEWCVSFEML